MPVTIAHPAAVLPLRRRGLVFSALVIGSMAPDFEYFFGLTRPDSHSMPGIVTFTFPLALAVLLVFHGLLKWPLISLLPRAVQARVIGPARRYRWSPAGRFALVLLSLAIGIATHILWDGFTHADGWAVMHYAGLLAMVPLTPHRFLPMFAVLQHAGTAAGVLALAVCFVRWYARARPEEVTLQPQFSATARWMILCVMMMTALGVSYRNGAAWYGNLFLAASPRGRFVTGFAISTVFIAAVELLGFSLIWRNFLAGGRQPSAAPARDHEQLTEDHG